MFAVPEGPSEAKIPITVRRIHLIRRPYAKRRGRRETMFDCPLSKTVKILDQRSCRTSNLKPGTYSETCVETSVVAFRLSKALPTPPKAMPMRPMLPHIPLTHLLEFIAPPSTPLLSALTPSPHGVSSSQPKPKAGERMATISAHRQVNL